jgi:hypothetical protein
MSALEKLIDIGGPPLLTSGPILTVDIEKMAGFCAGDILALLEKKNGFYAFESALHVFPAGSSDGVMDIATWNSGDLWRNYYRGMADGNLFFAEDVFGFQFSIRSDGIYSFNSESGIAEKVADSIEEWAALVLNDYEFQTGFPFAHEWQVANRPLLAHERLFPKYPFVLGGKYELSNIVSSNAVYGMQFRGYVADQIKDLPEGTRVELVFNPQ